MTRRAYVYTVTMHYDSYDHYSLGIADSLPVAKRLAQSDYTAYDLPNVAPTLRWVPKSYVHHDKSHRYWVAMLNKYGREYHIDKQEIVTTREVP